MKRLVRIFLFIIFLSVFCSSFQRPVCFQGRVFDKESMQTVSGVTVHILKTGYETETDDSGNYHFKGLKPVDAVLVFEYEGYEKAVVQAVVLVPGRTYRMDVALVAVE